MARRNPSGEALTDLVLKVSRLHAELQAVAEGIASAAALTAAQWQVLASVLSEPLTVAEVARALGLARQSVQRVADLLVAQGLSEYRENPAHQRAKFLSPTAQGWEAIETLRPLQAAWANRSSVRFNEKSLATANAVLGSLLEVVEAPGSRPRKARA